MADKKVILDALGEAREHLILNKFNDSMMLMAQITIDVIEHLTDEALIVSKGYEEDLNTLKSMGILTDDTTHNFETLIISGIQAHNGVDIPREHAEKALEVLTNELDLLFKNEDVNVTPIDSIDGKAKFNSENKENSPMFEYTEDEEPYKGDFSKDMTSDGTQPAFLYSDDTDFRAKEKKRKEKFVSEKNRASRKKSFLIAAIIPIVLILILGVIAKNIFFSAGPKESKKNIIKETIETTENIIIETTETEPTTPPAPPEAGYYNLTGNLVKVRDKASKEDSKVKGTVNKGDKVLVKKFVDSDWAQILYEGNEAYISRQYIKKDEDLTNSMRETTTIVKEEIINGVAPTE